ncbi:MAG: 4Fe-4S dicluster domain-containing protein [Candidatus Tritonobacter lacicola]|nr:4Fe-4S dicluster domain-containing protein [Candidatus Tritonobacter lacicola]
MRRRLSRDTLRSDFVRKVAEISGQNLLACYQCGKCSAGCPVVSEMDILPSQVIRLAQLGSDEEVLNSRTIWLCASCMTCMARCPKGVDLAKVMEALRLIRLRKNIDHVDISSIDAGKLPQIAVVSNLRKFTG